MDKKTWTKKREAGLRDSPKAQARRAARKAVVDLFQAYPTLWFDTFSVTEHTGEIVSSFMLQDLRSAGILESEDYDIGSQVPMLFRLKAE